VVHQPGRLGQRDELVRRDEAAHRVLPAQQGLHAQHAAVVHRDLGLVVQVELVRVQRPAQLGEQPEAVGGVAVRRRVVDLDL
jgi:hypothetical protein